MTTDYLYNQLVPALIAYRRAVGRQELTNDEYNGVVAVVKAMAT